MAGAGQVEVVERVANALHRSWIEFIRHGDPNHAGLPPWRPYRADDRAVLVVGANDIRVVAGMPIPALCQHSSLI